MVHGLMAQSGGRLIMKSSPGEGTTAELWLPVVSERVEPLAAKSDASPPPSKPVRPLSVMAVDDDNLVLMNTALMLEDLGHKVHIAHSAVEALELLEQEPLPDMIITDHVMPQITGAELAKRVVELHPEIKIILATGYAELPDGAGAGLAKLWKPFTQKQLNNALSTVFNLSG